MSAPSAIVVGAAIVVEVGGGSADINDFGLGAARYTNAAALLAMPIFNAGRTQAINDIAESGQREAVLRYEDAIAALVTLGGAGRDRNHPGERTMGEALERS